jgi:hypothetical protein
LAVFDRTKATPNTSGPWRSVLGSNSNFLLVKSLSAQLSSLVQISGIFSIPATSAVSTARANGKNEMPLPKL